MKIQILGGSYPIQKSRMTRRGWHIRYAPRKTVAYTPRAAIGQLEKISDNKNRITFKVFFNDGAEIICTTHRNIYDSLHAAMTLGPQPGDIAVLDLGYEPFILSCLKNLLILGVLGYAIVQSQKAAHEEKAVVTTGNVNVVSYLDATCCRLIGLATSCGYDTAALSAACGSEIDRRTDFGTPERGQELKLCMLQAEAGVKYPPPPEACPSLGPLIKIKETIHQ